MKVENLGRRYQDRERDVRVDTTPEVEVVSVCFGVGVGKVSCWLLKDVRVVSWA